MSELHDIVSRARNLMPSTKARYLRDLNRWIKFAGEDASGWTSQQMQNFYDHLLDVEKLRPQSADRLIASVQFASKWRAQFAGKAELDFGANVQKARAYEFDEKRALKQEEVTQLIKSLDSDDPAALRDLAIAIVLLETGMRKMSIVSMTIERTIIDDEQIAAGTRPYPFAWVRMKGAGKVDVDVPLSDTAVYAIKRWRAWLFSRGITRGPLFRGLDNRMGPRGPAITASRSALHDGALNKILDRRAADAGIEHIFPHQFRHTFITWRLKADLKLHEIAAITRHSMGGGIYAYIDHTELANKVRNSTPDWLRALVIKS